MLAVELLDMIPRPGKHNERVKQQGRGSRPREQWTQNPRQSYQSGKPKDLMLMPARVALALQADGWWVRSEVIWHKPNPMPESVTDRPTNAHEKVFLLTKSAKYFYDAEAVRVPHVSDPKRTMERYREPSAGSGV